MPQYCVLKVDLNCFNCGRKVDDKLEFQWGKVPENYAIGNKIKWLKEKSGAYLPPFVLYERKNSWNCGDPKFQNLLILDCNVYAPGTKNICPLCHIQIASAGIKIKDTVISNAFTLSANKLVEILGDYVGRADILIVQTDGTLIPRDDWFNPTIRYVPKEDN